MKAWSKKDIKALAEISRMRAAGWSMKQMTTGTGYKRSRIIRLIDKKREELKQQSE